VSIASAKLWNRTITAKDLKDSISKVKATLAEVEHQISMLNSDDIMLDRLKQSQTAAEGELQRVLSLRDFFESKVRKNAIVQKLLSGELKPDLIDVVKHLDSSTFQEIAKYFAGKMCDHSMNKGLKFTKVAAPGDDSINFRVMYDLVEEDKDRCLSLLLNCQRDNCNKWFDTLRNTKSAEDIVNQVPVSMDPQPLRYSNHRCHA
jgi:hypothetical protein